MLQFKTKITLFFSVLYFCIASARPDLGATYQNMEAAPLTQHAINAVRALIDQGNSFDDACEKYCTQRQYKIPLGYLHVRGKREELLRDPGIHRAIKRYEAKRKLRVKEALGVNFPKVLAAIISDYDATKV